MSVVTQSSCNLSPSNTLCVTVQCALIYEVTELTPIMLAIFPHPELDHRLVVDELGWEHPEPVSQHIDAQGNRILQTCLVPGTNEIRHRAVLHMPVDAPLPAASGKPLIRPYRSQFSCPDFDVLRYTLPSRYCEADKLTRFARRHFGEQVPTEQTVRDICTWTHEHIEYRYGSGDAALSACDAILRGYGVCRDFAHVMVALCRALEIPARYVAGHMPVVDDEEVDPSGDLGIDFHAYVEVFIDGAWRVFDPRYNAHRPTRIKVAHGRDAVDAAFATFFGAVRPVFFEVRAFAYSLNNAVVAS